MLECQRNGESSFAVSASTCIHKEEGERKTRNARACTGPVSAPVLSAVLIPAIFN